MKIGVGEDPPVYALQHASLVGALGTAGARWDCPCGCGGYALYAWRQVNDIGDGSPTKHRRHGPDTTVIPDQQALFIVASRTFHNDRTIRLIGIETVDEIDAPNLFDPLPVFDRELFTIWFAIGLADRLREEMTS